jgi:hypothetical protein
MGAPSGFLADGWLALTGLISAALALPLAQSAWHGPEVAAILAVGAVALLAGQRWAIAVIALGDLFLLPTVLPRAVLGPGGVARLVALATIVATMPGVLTLPRAATTVAAITGRTGTEQVFRTRIGLFAVVVFAAIAPLL